jgi:hypothetical protein
MSGLLKKLADSMTNCPPNVYTHCVVGNGLRVAETGSEVNRPHGLSGLFQSLLWRRMVMKTGQDVVDSGLYVSECCGVEVELHRDASFPRCRRCSSLSVWELVEEIEEKAA